MNVGFHCQELRKRSQQTVFFDVHKGSCSKTGSLTSVKGLLLVDLLKGTALGLRQVRETRESDPFACC